MSGIDLHRVRAAIDELCAAMRQERARAPASPVHRLHADAAANLIDYLVLRRADRRELQRDLRALGLSTLGRCEACVLPTLDAVRTNLDALLGLPPPTSPSRSAFDAADAELEAHTAALLGPPVTGRAARVMVTLPSEAATDRTVVTELLDAGMGIARINAAHDEPGAWAGMAAHIRAEAAARARACPIFVDLPGPKLRTTLPPGIDRSPRVNASDEMLLVPPDWPQRAGLIDPGYAVIGCADGPVLARVRAGQHVWFDDGKIGTVVLAREADGSLRLRVESTLKPDAPIKPDRGINVPDTELAWETWTDADEQALSFAVERADMVGLSFVSRPDEIARVRDRAQHLARALAGHTQAELGLVLKVETRRGFASLPALLLELMRSPRCGVMIARGDLAVEVGTERLAEVQEEILWLCEAARVPVIWATQVLETLAKKGRATRAEITDAAMSVRAECVMLNKGPAIARAVRTLDDILRRMQPHQAKKRAMLRRLDVAARWPDDPGAGR